MKICGVTQEREVESLVDLGVGFFGLLIDMGGAYSISEQRAAQLVSYSAGGSRGTIVTKLRDVDSISRLVENTDAPAIQLAGFTSARRIAKLRERFEVERLTIIQVIHFQGGVAAERNKIDAYQEAGVDYFIVDSVGDDGALGSTGQSIDIAALKSFREETRCAVPILVAGGVNVANAKDLMTAVGAVGVDVFSSVRDDSGINAAKVADLIEAVS